MVLTKEQMVAYSKKYREKNRQKIADKMKIYRENNKIKKADYLKIYRKNNKQKIAEKKKIYHQTPKSKKSHRISKWKHRGIITDDYDYWYELYIEQNHCWHCEKEFIDSRDRNLDHNHSITDRENIRGILCRTCNFKDIYK
tara:strand:+ start:592 stop:1014 length:423 start_codon:yes stop_codon:yes gene_type:complete